MTSILFLVETIQCKSLKYIYRKNKKLFQDFSAHFSNLLQILNIYKKDDPHSLCISEITDPKSYG